MDARKQGSSTNRVCNAATRFVATTLGVLVGIGSIDHGLLECLQGSQPDSRSDCECPWSRLSLDGVERRWRGRVHAHSKFSFYRNRSYLPWSAHDFLVASLYAEAIWRGDFSFVWNRFVPDRRWHSADCSVHSGLGSRDAHLGVTHILEMADSTEAAPCPWSLVAMDAGNGDSSIHCCAGDCSVRLCSGCERRDKAIAYLLDDFSGRAFALFALYRLRVRPRYRDTLAA